MGSKHVRLWEEAYSLLLELSQQTGYAISSLASAIIIEALKNPAILRATLIEWFNIDTKTANRIIADITEKAVNPFQSRLVREGEPGRRQSPRYLQLKRR